MNEAWTILNKIESILHGVEFGSLIAITFALFVASTFGLSIYHVVMHNNENSNYFLLNVLYEQLAVVFQVNSFVIAGKVRHHFELNRPSSFKYFR